MTRKREYPHMDRYAWRLMFQHLTEGRDLKEVERRAGLPPGGASQRRNGYTRVTTDDLIAVAQVARVSVSELLRGLGVHLDDAPQGVTEYRARYVGDGPVEPGSPLARFINKIETQGRDVAEIEAALSLYDGVLGDRRDFVIEVRRVSDWSPTQ